MIVNRQPDHMQPIPVESTSFNYHGYGGVHIPGHFDTREIGGSTTYRSDVAARTLGADIASISRHSSSHDLRTTADHILASLRTHAPGAIDDARAFTEHFQGATQTLPHYTPHLSADMSRTEIVTPDTTAQLPQPSPQTRRSSAGFGTRDRFTTPALRMPSWYDRYHGG